jgi:hypothetical protein
MNFSGRWIGRRETIAWPPRSPDLTLIDFSLWGHVKGRVYNQRVNMLDELKARNTATIANVTKDTLQRAWQEDCSWVICRDTDGAHLKFFAPNICSTCA